MPTGPIASTSTRDDGEINSENNGGAGVGSDTQTLSSLQATVKLLSDQMAWFVDKLKEPETELDSVVIDGALDCPQLEAKEGEILDALIQLGNGRIRLVKFRPTMLGSVHPRTVKMLLTEACQSNRKFCPRSNWKHYLN